MKPKRTVIMFQKRFVPLIESGAKQNTIRGRYIDPGTVLSLRRWTEKPYRSKQDVIKEVICTGCHAIFIRGRNKSMIESDYVDENIIARIDGFDSKRDMIHFFKEVHDLPWAGYLIRWDSKTDQEFIESVRLK